MRKQAIIIGGVVTALIIFSAIFMYFAYMTRVETTFINVKKAVLESSELTNKIGHIKQAKFDNYLQWISKENGKDCVRMIITTEDNTKHKICVIVDTSDSNKPPIVTGYIINNKEIMEDTKS